MPVPCAVRLFSNRLALAGHRPSNLFPKLFARPNCDSFLPSVAVTFPPPNVAPHPAQHHGLGRRFVVKGCVFSSTCTCHTPVFLWRLLSWCCRKAPSSFKPSLYIGRPSPYHILQTQPALRCRPRTSCVRELPHDRSWIELAFPPPTRPGFQDSCDTPRARNHESA